LFLCCFLIGKASSQIINLPCLTNANAFVGLDRKNWNNGNTANHSEGYMLNFALPTNTFGICKKIESVDIDFTINSIDDSGLPADCLPGGIGNYWTNIYLGCPSFAPASCPVGNIISEFPSNPIGTQTVSFTCPPDDFPFGEILGVDIIPAVANIGCTNGQSMVSTGGVTIDFEICVTVTVGDDEISTPVDLGPDLHACMGETLPIDAGPGYSNYDWDPNGQGSQVINEGPGIYTVTVTDGSGCTDTDEIEITTSNPTVSINSNDPDNTICNGETIILTANTTESNILWSTNQTSNSISVGSGFYTVQVTDINNCTATASIQIDEHPIPTVSLTADMTTVCGSAQTNITASPGFVDYDWSNGDGTQTITVGSGTYTVVVTDINGCEASETIQIFSANPPNAGSASGIVVCNDGSTYNIDGNLGVHDPGGDWADLDASGVDINANPFNVSFLGVSPGFYDFSYTVFGTPPCTDDAEIMQIEVVQGADAGTSNSIVICANDPPVDFFAEIATTDQSGFWTDVSGSGVDLSNPSSVDFSTTTNGVYMFDYEVLATAPCNSAMATLTVTVDAAANAGNDMSVSICEGAQYNLLDALDVLADLGGTFSDDSNTSALTGTVFNTTGFAGQTLMFTYTVGSTNCGADQAVISVEVVSSVSAGDDSAGNIFCVGEVIDLFTVLDNEDAGGIFIDASSSGALNGNLFDTQISGIGVYNISYQIGDNIICPLDESMIEITVVDAPSIAMNEAFDLCPNECFEFLVVLDGQGSLSFSIDVFEAPNINTLTYTDSGLAPDLYFVTVCSAAQNAISNDTIFLVANPLTWSLVPSSVSDDQCTNQDVTMDTVSINTFSAYSELIEQDLCSNDSLIIAGIVFNSEMPSATIDLSSINGCDSTIFVDLNILDTPVNVVDDTFCTGETITIGGIEFSESKPSDTILLNAAAVSGCDSIIEVNLSFVQSFNTMDEAFICQGDSIEINGTWVKDEGLYTLQLISTQQCDSIVELSLFFFPPSESLLDPTLCEGGMIIVNGTVYDENNPTGIEIIEDASIHGCDSTVTIDLAFSNEIVVDLNSEICFGDSVQVAGVWYFDDTVVTNSEVSSSGCDSTTNTTIFVHPENVVNFNQGLCNDGSIVINGTTYDIDNPSGTEILENQDVNGCDSTILVALSFANEITSTAMENICVGDSIFLAGAWQFVAGAYLDSYISASGCDSTVTTTLTVETCLDLGTVEIIDNVCAGDANGSICVTINAGSVPLVVEWENTTTGETGALTISTIGNQFCESSLLSGNYNLRYLDNTGTEVAASSYTIQDLNSPLTGNIVITKPLDCFGDSDASLEVDVNGGAGIYTYSWNQNLGTNPTINNLGPGTYEVLVKDAEQCELFLDIVIAEPQQMSFTVDGFDSACAEVSNGMLRVSNINPITQDFSISVNGAALGSPYELDNLSAGSYEVILTNGLSCSITSMVVIQNEQQNILIDYTDSYQIQLMDSVAFLANYPSSVDSVLWSPLDEGISCTSCLYPVFSPSMSASYILNIFDMSGCTEQVAVTINVVIPEVDVYVPNIFSPNDDGINDVFLIGFADSVIEEYTLSVFDRWGNRVYDRTLEANSLEGWDGKYKQNRVVPGVYSYLVSFEDPNRGDIVIGGSVTVVQ